jgi:uncharacterized delta-60 repeat protein
MAMVVLGSEPLAAADFSIGLVPDTSFRPTFEKNNEGSIGAVVRAPGGGVYVAGELSGLGDSPVTSIVRVLGDGSVDPEYVSAIVTKGSVVAMVVDAAGRLVIGGDFEAVSGVRRSGVVRLHADGSLDESFVPPIGADRRVRCLGLQSNGRLLIATQSSMFRLLPDGTMDFAFPERPHVAEFGIQPDDRIVIRMDNGGALRRLSAGGADDDTFVQQNDATGQPHALHVAADGKIYIAGGLYEATTNQYLPIVRLNADGTVDGSFRSSGFLGNQPLVIRSWSADSVYVAGRHYMDPGASLIHRLGSDGAIDAAFGTGPRTPLVVGSLAVLDDGSLFAAGDVDLRAGFVMHELLLIQPDGVQSPSPSLHPRSPGTVRVLRRTRDGCWLVGGDFDLVDGIISGGLAKLDEAGRVVESFEVGAGFDGVVEALTEDDTGRIIVGGAFSSYRGTTAPNLVRLTAQGEFDTSFQPGSGPNGAVRALLRHADGRVTVAGEFTTFDGAAAGRIVRVREDGSRDTGFTSTAGFSDAVTLLHPWGPDRILAGGKFRGYGDTVCNGIARLMDDGTHDSGFVLSPSNNYSPLYALGVSPDGSRVVASNSWGVFWLESDGSRIPYLDTNGRNRGDARAILVEPDGSILAAGAMQSSTTYVVRSPIARIRPDGHLDESFRATPHLLDTELNYSDRFTGLAKLEGSRYLVAGRWTTFDRFVGRGLVLYEPDPRPVITVQPESVRTRIGADATFAVDVLGKDLEFQWYHDEVAIAGANDRELTLRSITARAAGTYHVVVYNGLGSIRSREVELTGDGTPPIVSSTPQSIGVRSGETARFAVNASGSGPLRYVWRHEGIVVARTDAPEFAVSPAKMRNAGLYEVEVIGGLESTRAPAGRLEVYPESSTSTYRHEPVARLFPEIEGGSATIVVDDGSGGAYVAGTFDRVGGVRSPQLVRIAPDGSVDTSFRAPAVPDGGILAMAAQADGKLIIAGSFTSVAGFECRGIARLWADGALDRTFDTGYGFDKGGGRAFVHAIELLADGRVVAAGEFSAFDGHARDAIVRLLQDGSLDEEFNSRDSFSGEVRAVRVLHDGGILVAGNVARRNPSDPREMLIDRISRLDANGDLDPTFPLPSGIDSAVETIAVQPDGGVLLGGAFREVRGLLREGMARLNPDGSVDASFNASFGFGSNVASIQVEADGGIMVAGKLFRVYPLTGASLVRLSNIGVTDPAFVAVPGEFAVTGFRRLVDGRVLTCGEPAAREVNPLPAIALFESNGARVGEYAPKLFVGTAVSQIARAPDGGFFLQGPFTHVNGEPRRHLIRVDRSGELHAGFNPPETVLLPAATIAVTPDGCVYTHLNAEIRNQPNVTVLARLLEDGTRDPAFEAALDAGAILAVQADGKVLVQVPALDSNGIQVGTGIRRLDRYGAIDTTFATGTGFARQGGGGPLIASVAVQADGRVLVGGDFASFNGVSRRGVVRLRTDGVLDPTFDASAVFTAIDNIKVNTIRVLVSGEIAVGTRSGLLMLDPHGGASASFPPSQEEWGIVQAMAPIDPDAVLVGETPHFGGIWSRLLERVSGTGERSRPLDDAHFQASNGSPQVDSLLPLDDRRVVMAGRGFPGGDGALTGLSILLPEPYVGSINGPSNATSGARVTLAAEIDDPSYSYRWFLDGREISGAASATLSIPMIQGFHRGTYRVSASKGGETSNSESFHLDVLDTPTSDARFMNLSTRAYCLEGESALIPGFVIAGPVAKRMLVRAVGPGLAEFGVEGALLDPTLVVRKLVGGQYLDIAENNDWNDSGDTTALAATSVELGAFPLRDGSMDAALLLDLEPGHYTALARDSESRPGVALVELYDADATASAGGLLMNISNRGYVGDGGQVTIPGFVVSNEGPRRFLIRAVGPALTGHGVVDFLADPQLAVFRAVPGESRDEFLFANDDWGDNPMAEGTATIAEAVGAFPLGAASKDAALVVTLPPGSYTVHVSGVGGSTGVALVEVYLVP